MFLDLDRPRGRPAAPNWGRVFRVVLAAAESPLDHVLAGMVAAGLGVEALCHYLGFARPELFGRLSDLGLPAPHERPLRRIRGRNPWLPEDVRELISWWIAGVHVRSIADAIGVDRGAAKRSRGAIYAKSRRLGLPPRNRKRLVYRTVLELSGYAWIPGVSIDVEGVWVPSTASASAPAPSSCPSPPPPSSSAPASASSPAPAPTSASSSVTVAAMASASASPSRLIAKPVTPVFEPVFGFDAVSAEPEQHPVVGELDGRGEFGRPVAVPLVFDGGGAAPNPANRGLFGPPVEKERAAESIGTRPLELLAGMGDLERLWKKTCGAGNGPDWTRMKMTREFILEIALRGLDNQSNSAIADAMGITCKKAGGWVSRLDIRRELPGMIPEFDAERAFAALESKGLVPRTCKKLKRLFFAPKHENAQYCREGWRKLNKMKQSESVLKVEEPGKQRGIPSMPVLKFLSRPMPEGCEDAGLGRWFERSSQNAASRAG